MLYLALSPLVHPVSHTRAIQGNIMGVVAKNELTCPPNWYIVIVCAYVHRRFIPVLPAASAAYKGVPVGERELGKALTNQGYAPGRMLLHDAAREEARPNPRPNSNSTPKPVPNPTPTPKTLPPKPKPTHLPGGRAAGMEAV